MTVCVCVYLDSAVDELTGVNSQPRQVHDGRPRSRVVPEVSDSDNGTINTPVTEQSRLTSPWLQQQQQQQRRQQSVSGAGLHSLMSADRLHQAKHDADDDADDDVGAILCITALFLHCHFILQP